jgi:hypothetical protein
MAQVIIDDTNLKNIADAIRFKTGATQTYKPNQMASAIKNMTVGEQVIPPDALSNSSAPYKYCDNNWNWFIEEFGPLIEYQTLEPYLFFGSSSLNVIPFKLETNWEMHFGLANCRSLNELPEIIPKFLYTECYLNNIFSGCINIREIPYNFFGADAEANDWEKERPAKNYEGARNALFYNCYSLRALPDLAPAINIEPDPTKSLYYQMCNNCYALDEIVNLPVSKAQFTENAFGNSFTGCHRIKNMTFETDNGVAKTANWANQAISLSTYIGYTVYTTNLTQYNAGVSGVVDDDADYSKYKDTANWYASRVEYSRYNKTSAVNTINSLPDTSAFLATNGGTNSISFKGTSGKYTDGGAIDTMTEEQIAVATAKGWTVAIK